MDIHVHNRYTLLAKETGGKISPIPIQRLKFKIDGSGAHLFVALFHCMLGGSNLFNSS
ncbi:hypothetical protein [uncultured Aquimarina sp.]|uniref:hypothetical protein n=1 Tax=uncultured Aquimarina sp. TaxID=575652 RepID=UPI00261A49AA|nr:hypothetical protein [uncultured Aquimarina sp.]